MRWPPTPSASALLTDDQGESAILMCRQARARGGVRPCLVGTMIGSGGRRLFTESCARVSDGCQTPVCAGRTRAGLHP
jgi:hypothetical protein